MMGKQITTVLSLILVALLTGLTSAQAVRDYAITSVDYELIEDNQAVIVTIVVVNNGADATSDTNVIVRLLGDTPRILFSDVLSQLDSGISQSFQIAPLPIDLFQGVTDIELEISVGVDRFELANTPLAEDNVATLTVNIPNAGTNTSDSITIFERVGDTIIIFDEAYTLVEFSLAILAFIGFLVFFWIFSIIVRAVFKRAPRFGAWQPPYGVTPMYDQNTIEGRRWGWQQLAQNGLLLAPTTEGNIHPVKLLTSIDEVTLQNWKVTGMRLSQYDVYGRIARTQVLAEKKWVRRMNNVLKKRSSIDEAKLQKMLRPIADRMVKQFTKNVGHKTAFLPIAFDMRWEGKHGDVRIIFELYQFAERAWFRIDQWDPMMQVVSQTMQENYTFTIHGKDAAEKMRDFRERLRDDLIWLLLESFRIETVTQDQTGEQPAVRQQYNVPDTLSGMEPIQADDQPMPSQPIV